MAMSLVRLLSGPVTGLLIFLIMRHAGVGAAPSAVAMTAVWMATWWITEAVPIGVTSLLPFILFPLLGVMDASVVAMQYMEQTIFLFIGGFFLAFALEKWNLHTRIAYRILLLTGTSPSQLLAGVMLTAFLISMWISNTATVLMLIAAVTAMITMHQSGDDRARKKIACGLMLALSYSATIGGISTLVGTPPNMVFAGFVEKTYQGAFSITFNRWFAFAFPFSALFIIASYFILRHLFISGHRHTPFSLDFIRQELKKRGPLSTEEKWLLTVFSLMVLLWFSRSSITLGTFSFPGWSSWLPFGHYIRDSTVAITLSALLFFIPSRTRKGERILEWKDVNRLPFRIILLFGSGFALAEGFERSGLAALLANRLEGINHMPGWLLLLILIGMITLLSEFASNVASVQLVLPVLAPLAVSLHADPLTLMAPATIAASLGYMMPVATAANTIVYGSGYVPVGDMMRAGLLLNLTGMALLLLVSNLIRF
jgi:sodium-dependent dicarboxylate transporter 2/3/5